MAYVQKGNRGGKILVHEGHRYQKNKEKGNKIYWRCWRRTCNVFLQTDSFNIDARQPNIHVLRASQHNHPAETELISGVTFKERVYQLIEADPTMPIRRVYNEAVRAARRGDVVPEFHSLRSMMNRKRASVLPPIPQDVEDVAIVGRWAQTWWGKRFLARQDNDWGIIVFGTDRNYTNLSRCVS